MTDDDSETLADDFDLRTFVEVLNYLFNPYRRPPDYISTARKIFLVKDLPKDLVEVDEKPASGVLPPHEPSSS